MEKTNLLPQRGNDIRLEQRRTTEPRLRMNTVIYNTASTSCIYVRCCPGDTTDQWTERTFSRGLQWRILLRLFPCGKKQRTELKMLQSYKLINGCWSNPTSWCLKSFVLTVIIDYVGMKNGTNHLIAPSRYPPVQKRWFSVSLASPVCFQPPQLTDSSAPAEAQTTVS